METLFAASPPGLEHLVASELAALGLRKPQLYFKSADRTGGVEFQGPLEAAFQACLKLRSAERVFVRLGRFPAAAMADVERAASALPWRRFVPEGRPVEVKVKVSGSKLSERSVAERLARAAGLAPAADASAQLVVVRVEGETCVVDLDASGEPLHRRGYRLALAKAPLRETLAAALLLASEWDAASPLLDPFCGSGTIAIEAALLAAGIAPGARRRFAFMGWPCFEAARWKTPAPVPRGSPKIAASDRDAGAIAAARANAERAGVAHLIEFRQAAVSAAEPPPGPGWVVTNPPYGLRVDAQRDVRDVYAQLGKLMRARCPGWRAMLLCPGLPLARATGLPFVDGPSTKNGGLDVRFARL